MLGRLRLRIIDEVCEHMEGNGEASAAWHVTYIVTICPPCQLAAGQSPAAAFFSRARSQTRRRQHGMHLRITHDPLEQACAHERTPNGDSGSSSRADGECRTSRLSQRARPDK